MKCQSFGNVKTPPPPELSVFSAVAMAVVALVATCGNLSVVITIIKDPLKKLHNPFNYFLLSLALSDFLLGSVTMPLGVATLVQEYLKQEKTLSKALHMTMFMSGTASLLSLIALSIDRYAAVKYSSKYRQMFTGRRCAIICSCLWIFSFSFPFLYFAWDYIGYMMFFSHSAIFVALLTMFVTQQRTKKFLQQKNKEMLDNIATSAPTTSVQAAEDKERKRETKMSRLYLMILLFFVGIYVPSVVMIYILHFCESCDCTFRHVLRDLSFLLISANSCVNPFLYAFRVGNFRLSLTRVFCFCNRRSPGGDRANNYSI